MFLRACVCKRYVGPSEPWGPDNCFLCWQLDNDPRYAERPTFTRRRKLPCVHLGDETGETKTCNSCGARGQEVPLRQCGKFGSCYVPAANPNVHLTGVQRCNQACPGYEERTHAPARAGDPACGVVIGVYQWPKLAEVQVRAIRHSCGLVPILLSDDHSPDDRWEYLEGVAERYPDVLVRRNHSRIGHAGGDLSAFHRGLLWAQSRGLKVLAKLSQRFVAEAPYWLQDGAKALLESGKAAASSPCKEHRTRFAIRSEAVLLDVERMNDPHALSHLTPRRLRSAAEPHVWAAVAAAGGMAPWSLIQEDRMIKDAGVTWHCSARDEDYHALAARHGLTLDVDFTASGVHKMPWYQWG